MRENIEVTDGVTVYTDKGAWEDYDHPEYPYYRLRGKRITEEQALEVIRYNDWFFRHGKKNIYERDDRFADVVNAEYGIFPPMFWFDRGYGWVHPNGVVGINDTIGYRKRDELINELMPYVKRFPFLDFVIAFSKWEVRCPVYWEMQEEILDSAMTHRDPEWYIEDTFDIVDNDEETRRKIVELEFDDPEENGFEDVLFSGVWVHDGVIEIMSPERTAEVYRKYESLYGEKDKRVYAKNYYNVFEPDIINMDLLYRCLGKFGVEDPQSFLEKSSDRIFLLSTERLSHMRSPEGNKNKFLYTERKIDYMPKRTIDGVKVYIDKGVSIHNFMEARRPYYQMRGKPVTRQQALEIICTSDDFFLSNLKMPGYSSEHFPMEWFPRERVAGWGYGWVHPDGTVGINAHTGKLPSLFEIIQDLTGFAEDYPFLDMVIALTTWDEIYTGDIASYWDNEEEYKKAVFNDTLRKEFDDVIEAGLWVHDGVIEAMDPKRTAAMYRNYERLYQAEDKRIYTMEYYEDFRPNTADKEYLFECLSARGIGDPEKFILDRLSEHEIEYLMKNGYTFDNYKKGKKLPEDLEYWEDLTFEEDSEDLTAWEDEGDWDDEDDEDEEDE